MSYTFSKKVATAISTATLVLLLSACGGADGDTPWFGSPKDNHSSSSEQDSKEDKPSTDDKDSDKEGKKKDSSKSKDDSESKDDGSKEDTSSKGIADGYYDGMPVEEYAKKHGMKVNENGMPYKEQEVVTDENGDKTTKKNYDSQEEDSSSSSEKSYDDLYEVPSGTQSTLLQISSKFNDALTKGDYKNACKYVTISNGKDCVSTLSSIYSKDRLDIHPFTKSNAGFVRYDVDSVKVFLKKETYEKNQRTMFQRVDGEWKIRIS